MSSSESTTSRNHLPYFTESISKESQNVISGLKQLYTKKIKPLEMKYQFHEFHSPLLNDADFDAKPQVLMIGQYSVGKTSFIQYLLGRDFPGQRIGPEPTTDRFVAVMHGAEDRIIPGNALAVSTDMPYYTLSMFGTSFLNKFEASVVPAKILQHITFIDTPGILAGAKQRISRGYDFVQVTKWFAEHSDLILLLFDAHKLDISDEFQRVIEILKGHDDKIRCVLNKADQIDQQHLMRVYGALMWSMGKVLRTPEVLRVYIGSFWNQPRVYTENASLFDAEEKDLMHDLISLPKNAAIRKINELVKRTRLAKVHAYIIAHLREKMPALLGKEKKQKELIDTLDVTFREVQRKYNLAPGDFPDIDEFRKHLMETDFTKFPKLSKIIDDLDSVLASDIPKLMEALPKASKPPSSAASNPFIEAEKASNWVVAAYKAEFDKLFSSLPGAEEGKVSGLDCMATLQGTGCGPKELRMIWELSDVDKDGFLDESEFALAMYLCRQTKLGKPIPPTLTDELMPPDKEKTDLNI